MTSITFTVPGTPVSKGRPRFTKAGHTFTPDRTVRFEERVCLWATNAGLPKTAGPIRVTVDAFWEWPKGKWRKREPRALQPKIDGPDLDNVVKAVLDGMAPFFNDRQVCAIRAHKWLAAQGDPARTEVVVDLLPVDGAGRPVIQAAWQAMKGAKIGHL